MRDLNDLLDLLQHPKGKATEIADLLSTQLAHVAIGRINQSFSVRRLSKATREKEPLPTDPKQLSSYRTRLGTMMEYAISTEIDSVLGDAFGEKLALTFAVAHEYPDFYLRDVEMDPVLRLEMKSVDAASDEQAARFETPTQDIIPDSDHVLFVAWEWKQENLREFPQIFAHVVVPCLDLALERDKRLQIVGGRIDGNRILVPSTKQSGQFVEDPGNYGKLWRIIHPTRRNADDLNAHVRQFLEFLRAVDSKSPHSRLGNPKDRRLAEFPQKEK